MDETSSGNNVKIDPVDSSERCQLILLGSGAEGLTLRISGSIRKVNVSGIRKCVILNNANWVTVERFASESLGSFSLVPESEVAQSSEQSQFNSGMTIRIALEKYIENQRLKPNTSSGYIRKTTDAFSGWLDRPLKDITPAMILERHKELLKPNKFGTMGMSSANTAMKILSMLINHAISNFGLKMDNPVTILSKNRSWYRLSRCHPVVTDHMLPAWWKAVSSLRRANSRDYFLLLMLTGLRRSEALSLRWENIDFEGKILTVPAELAKNHHEHCLPLSTVLYAMLAQRKRASNSAWIFPDKCGSNHMPNPTYSSQLIGRKSACNFSPHCARRTFVTVASRLGLPHHIVKKLVNHAQVVGVASTYIILSYECLREPMQQITDRFVSLMQFNPDDFYSPTKILPKDS